MRNNMNMDESEGLNESMNPRSPTDGMNVVVAVKSAWFSKINWTQAVGVLAGVVTLFGFDIPPETQAQILAGILAVQGAMTWIIKTWFTSTVAPSSMAK